MSVRAFIAKQLLSLSLSQVRSAVDSTTQAVMWHNQLQRLGLSLPLVVVPVLVMGRKGAHRRAARVGGDAEGQLTLAIMMR